MKIVILDSDPAFGSNRAGDNAPIAALDAPELAQLGAISIYENSEPEQVIVRAQDAEVILTNKVPLGVAEFSQLPHLKLVSVLATGVNVIDLQAARAHGVVVCNVPGYSTASTAQHCIALLLEVINQVGEHADHTRRDGWQNARAFSYFLAPVHELEGKTMGIVGLGSIGTRVAKIAEALGMKVIASSRTQRNDAPFPLVPFEELLARSDVVSLHCPLTADTRHLINRKSLEIMKRGAVLLNVARGPIVDESALADALTSGHLKAAAVDVLSEEPPRAGSPLFQAPNCIVTPHIAWASVEARTRLLRVSAENVAAFFRGEPQNVVS